jgi:hypothetical protein
VKNLLVCLTAIFLSANVSNAIGQEGIRATPLRSNQGFAQVVSELIADMKGAWKIKSAYLHGGDLPLDQFDSLTIDDHGFTLGVQDRERRFEFRLFRLDTRKFIAACSDEDYPKGLVYEIGLSDDVVKIRYRTDGAHVAPEQNTADDQLIVQEWVSDSKSRSTYRPDSRATG